MKKIIISGAGGQGIKMMAIVLGKILAKLGYNVSTDIQYDAAIRGGKITAFLTYSKEPIDNPLFEDPDVFLKLHKEGDHFVAEKVVCDKRMCIDGPECAECKACGGENFPFEELAEAKFGKKIMMNMIALGKLLKMLELDIEGIDLLEVLPEKFADKNKEAIVYGYTNFVDRS
ncbi:2-oxoacid:acceptor oxidoreductase family protein [Candidatus Woesearchaeota archaeon]|nr:2-oxoacid:acceptor oxidoreductase family protein [Candidatus Woesearchaeota archaeon]